MRSPLRLPDLTCTERSLPEDPMLDGLFGPAKCLRGGCRADPAGRSVWHHASDDLVRDVESPRCLRHDLVCFERAVASPATDRILADAQNFQLPG